MDLALLSSFVVPLDDMQNKIQRIQTPIIRGSISPKIFR